MQDLSRVPELVIQGCAGVKAGEHVLIMGRDDSLAFLEALSLEALRRGATALVVPVSDDYNYEMLTGLEPEMIERQHGKLADLVERADVTISVMMAFTNPARFADVPEAKLAARRRGLEPVRRLMMDGKRRWVGMDYPTPAQASTYGVDFDRFQSTFWQAMLIDYDELKRDCDTVIAGLSRGEVLHLTSPAGTDLTIEYGGRPIMRDDGIIDEDDVAAGIPLSNLPAGEVCFAPIETGTNGRLVVDLAFWQGHRIEGLVLEFSGGRARPISAQTGFDTFCRVLETSTGDCDVIGELGIGLNPNVSEAVGYMLVDEKLRGSVHIAIGFNKMLGGTNDSDLHWDLLVLNPTITVAGRPIIERGAVKQGD